jgi:hypothetical protein
LSGSLFFIPPPLVEVMISDFEACFPNLAPLPVAGVVEGRERIDVQFPGLADQIIADEPKTFHP